MSVSYEAPSLIPVMILKSQLEIEDTVRIMLKIKIIFKGCIGLLGKGLMGEFIRSQ